MAAFDINPADNDLLGANYTADSTTFTFTIADFANLTEAECAAATGDTRKILYGLLQDVYTRYVNLATDKPLKMTMARTTNVNDAAQTALITFTVRFTTADLAGDVAAES